MTLLPAVASAKVSMCLVGNQDPDDIGKKLEAHIKQHPAHGHAGPLPDSARRTSVDDVSRASRGEGGAARARKRLRPGAHSDAGRGSIPIVHSFTKVLGAPAVLLGFGQPDEGAHGPDEHFDLGNFQGGIRTLAYLLEEMAALSRRDPRKSRSRVADPIRGARTAVSGGLLR